MHPILGLIEDDRLRAIEHGVGNFCVAMRRQAVHKYRMRCSVRHQGFIHLIRFEDRRTLRRFMLETHTGADIGIHGICASDRCDRITNDSNIAAGDIAGRFDVVRGLSLANDVQHDVPAECAAIIGQVVDV